VGKVLIVIGGVIVLWGLFGKGGVLKKGGNGN
jgi:hypothetical protein